MSRRIFLKGLAAALFTTSIINFINHEINTSASKSAHSDTEQQKEFWQTLISYAEDIPTNVWLDGRTALMIAKHEDAMNFLRRSKYLTDSARGAIINGHGHAHKANLSRDKTIVSYAGKVNSIINDFISNHYNFSSERQKILSNQLLDFFAQLDINHVSDPGMPDESKPNSQKLADYIEANIIRVSTFKSPQVMKAIEPLRP